MIYKAVNGLASQYLRDMYILTSDVQLRPSRHTDNSTLYLPTGRNLHIFKDSFQYWSAEIWNNIPVEIREAQSLQSFNSAYIQWFSLNIHDVHYMILPVFTCFICFYLFLKCFYQQIPTKHYFEDHVEDKFIT